MFKTFFGITKSYSDLLLFCIPLFFILTAETSMAFIFPIYIVNNGLSNSEMGAILGFSAFVGLMCDFIVPEVFRYKTWKSLFVSSSLIALLFPILTGLGIKLDIQILFLIASLSWYIYFELLSFAQQLFVVEADKAKEYSKDWGTIFVILQMAGIAGPILVTPFMAIDEHIALMFICLLNLTALLLVLILFPNFQRQVKIEGNLKITKEFIKEFKLYKLFLRTAFSVITFFIVISFVSEMFWNLGGLFGQSMNIDEEFEWIIVTLFTLPLLIGPLIITRLKIKHNKKKISLLFLLLGSLSLSSLLILNTNISIFLAIFLTGIFYSFTYPLNEAVFSDIASRSGKSKIYLLSLIRITASFAYILSPVITGKLSDIFEYQKTFGLIGLAALVIAALLFIITPRKIKLPQKTLDQI